MKHAGEAVLDTLEPMLIELRKLRGIRERNPGVFYRKSLAFVHFHEDPAGIFVDVRRDRQWLRLPVNTSAERRQLVRLEREVVGSK
jgi:hypothetical protein